MRKKNILNLFCTNRFVCVCVCVCVVVCVCLCRYQSDIVALQVSSLVRHKNNVAVQVK